MFGLPLHPVAVHAPIVLALLIPFFALWSWYRYKTAGDRVSGMVTVVLAGAFSVTSFVAANLGERDEEVVERVVPEAVLEEHEEAGELAQWVAAGVFVVGLATFVPPVASIARAALVVASLAGAGAVVRAGHTGGLLVYKHDAARAHASMPGGASGGAAQAMESAGGMEGAGDSEDGHDDDDD